MPDAGLSRTIQGRCDPESHPGADQETTMPLPRHERAAILFMVQHAVYGIAGALSFGVGLLWLDVGGIGTLALASEQWALNLLLLFAGLFVTFGSVAIGVGVMRLGEDRY
jgi:hypothetical protein